ncbi:HAD-IA family hydrolase [Apilactobacillus xinyiensis]|uniref:HAD-IA family hydrolase n=1 Tax=Apilactobacillus xinyiensis TaxID=2841032 RepID=UPI001C7D4D49|nr:HAD-IA family hydrolase [Apilactobacillus xinyiensis]
MKNIIWDFDGTLFDTYPQMVNSFLLALKKMHIDEMEIDEYEIYEVMRRHSLSTAIQKYAAHYNLVADNLKLNYQLYEKQNILKSKPFFNLETLLLNTIKNDYSHFILTHRDKQTLYQVLENNHFADYFKMIITKDDNLPRKPNPAAINQIIEKNNLKKMDTLIIGDRVIDIRAGQNAGIQSILFDPDALIIENCNANHKFSNMYDLKLFLMNLGKDK